MPAHVGERELLRLPTYKRILRRIFRRVPPPLKVAAMQSTLWSEASRLNAALAEVIIERITLERSIPCFARSPLRCTRPRRQL